MVKRRYEKKIAKSFMESLDKDFEFYRMGNDMNEPDVLFRKEGEILGVEVTTAYYSNDDAKKLWDNNKFNDNTGRYGIEHPDKALCGNIKKRIGDKLNKGVYSGVSNTILLVDIKAPLSRRESIKECIANMNISDMGDFCGVYLRHKSKKEVNFLRVI